jgi:hypothetical protein
MARRDRVKDTNPLEKPNREVMTLADLTNQMTSEQRDKSLEKIDIPAGLFVADDGALSIGGYKLTSIGLVVDDKATYDDWETVGSVLLRLDGTIQLLIGDWLVQAERQWGRTYEEIAEHTGYAVKSLYQYKWVAESVTFSMRIENLTFTHYMVVAGIDDESRKAALLKQASAEGWSVKRLREEINPPTLPNDSKGEKNKIFRGFGEKMKEMKLLKRTVRKAGEGDDSARMEALGRIAKHRAWLDELEEWLSE